MMRSFGGVVVDQQKRLLLREVANHYDGYVWTFPKGRPEPGETPKAAALREVREETGYTAEIIRRLPGRFVGGTTMSLYYVMRPVGSPGLELLREMREANATARFLFPGEPLEGPNGEPIERPRADLKRPWAWIKKDAGLDDVRLHDIRRTTASFMISGGASLATVGKALGHTQASTTARYARLSDTVQREALKGAGERFAALRGTSPKGEVVRLPSAGLK